MTDLLAHPHDAILKSRQLVLRELLRETDSLPVDAVLALESQIALLPGLTGVNRRFAMADLVMKGYDQRRLAPSVVPALMAALDAPDGLRVLAHGIGTGAWIAGLSTAHHVTGTEIDADLAQVARRVLPSAAILADDMGNHDLVGQFDLIVGMPAFQGLMTPPCSGLAIERDDGTVESHVLWLDLAKRAGRTESMIVAILPTVWEGSDFKGQRNVLRGLTLLGAVRLPATAEGDALSAYVYFKGEPPLLSAAARRGAATFTEASTVALLPDAFAACFASALGRTARMMWQDVAGRWTSPVVLRRREQSAPKVRVLPETETVEVRIIPNGGHIVLVPNGQQAARRIAALHRDSGTMSDVRRSSGGKTARFSRFSEMLREPWEMVGTDVCAMLTNAGITPVMTQDQVTRLERRQRWLTRMSAPFEQVVKARNGAWGEAYADDGIRVVAASMVAEARAKMERMGLTAVLWPYQVDDVARLYAKPRTLLGSQVGLGKSITMVALSLIRGTRTSVVLCQSGLVGKWAAEMDRWQAQLPHLDLSYIVVDRLADMGTVVDGRLTDYTKLKAVRFVLVAYERLWSVPRDHYTMAGVSGDVTGIPEGGDALADAPRDGQRWHVGKHTFAAHLRKVCRRATVFADECYKLKNERTCLATGVRHLGGKSRLGASATPIRNYVTDLQPILNWLFGQRSALFRHFSDMVGGEREEFARAYATFLFYRTNDETGRQTRKMIPKIANAGAFRAMLAPFMLRRVKTEPAVASYCAVPEATYVRESITMDPAQHDFYRAIQDNFAEWWKDYSAACARTGRMPAGSAVLAKIAPLSSAAACPTDPKLNAMATVQYVGGVTSKQRRAVELVRHHAAQGDKVIVFAQTLGAVKVLAEALADMDPITVTGATSLTRRVGDPFSARDRMLNAFKDATTPRPLIASTKAIAEGQDLYQANVAILFELDWTPSIDRQAVGRMLRPQQEKPVTVYELSSGGTIDEYRALLSNAKHDAMREGLDDDAFTLDLGLIPDILDYASGVCEGLTLSELTPSRRVVKVVSGRQIVWDETMGESLVDALNDVAAPSVSAARMERMSVMDGMADDFTAAAA